MFSLLVRMAWEEHMEKKRHTTASGEDYLEAILVLKKKLGTVRSVDVARHMEVSISSLICNSVSSAIVFELFPAKFVLTALPICPIIKTVL